MCECQEQLDRIEGRIAHFESLIEQGVGLLGPLLDNPMLKAFIR